MILTHQILLALISYAIKEIQEWTNVDVPSGTKTKHDFGDGAVAAVPMDNGNVADSIVANAISVVDSGNVSDRIIEFFEMVIDNGNVSDRIMSSSMSIIDQGCVSDTIVSFSEEDV